MLYKWHVCPGSYNWKKEKRVKGNGKMLGEDVLRELGKKVGKKWRLGWAGRWRRKGDKARSEVPGEGVLNKQPD